MWYYWRWRIDGYFSLLKSRGHQIKHRQQETGIAIARRLLAALMACVVAWDLQYKERAETEVMK